MTTVTERRPCGGLRAPAISLVVAVASLMLAGALAERAFAAGPPSVTATPSTNLVDGQWVHFTFSGFTPGAAMLGFRECIPNPTNLATDCTNDSPYTSFLGYWDATGGASQYMPVYSDLDPLLKRAGTGTGDIVCDSSHPCVLAALTTPSSLAGAVLAPLTFARNTLDCPPAGSNAVFGSGSATAYRAIYQWQVATCQAPYTLPSIYAVSNSIDGLDTFGQGQNQANFAVTGPVPPFTLPSTAPSYKLAPITSSALVLAYTFYDRRGFQITDLTLTPTEIAGLFEGTESLYTDPTAAALNPGIQFQYNTQAVVRAEHAAETWVFTSWLSAVLGTGPTGWSSGPSAIFPNFITDTHASGSRGVATALRDPNFKANRTEEIGYMDSSTAAFYGFPTVRIALPGGATVAATAASIAGGTNLATPNADGSWTPDFTPSDPTAYPMSYPSYLVAPTNQITGDKGKVLAAFLKYGVQQGQVGLPPGYAPLPGAMVSQSLAVADKIPQASPAAAGAGGGADTGSAADAAALNESALGTGDLTNPYGDNGFGAHATPSASAAAATSGPPRRTASGPPIPAIALSSSVGRWMLLGVVAVAAFGIVAGPLTYVIARPWPPPWLRRLRRAMPFGRGGALRT